MSAAADPAGLQARIAELNAELIELRQQLDVAAVAVAEGEPDGAQRLTDVESAISARVRERGVAESALRGLAARDAARATAAQVELIEGAAKALPTAAAAVRGHWRDALAALRAFTAARRALHEAAGKVRRLAADARDPTVTTIEVADREPLARAGFLHATALDAALGALLYHMTDEGLTARITRGIAPARVDETEAALLAALERFEAHALATASQNTERLQAKREAA